MNWIKSLNQSIQYIEQHILEDISCGDIAGHIYSSSFHFQRIFSILTQMTVGEYIRNRRLSLAGQELLTKDVKVIDIALKYGYDTPESFTKAFSRFHGITPSQVKKKGCNLKSFNPLVIKIKLEGGTIMDYRIDSKEAFTVLAMTRTFTAENSKTEIPKFWDEFYQKGYGKFVSGAFGICSEMNKGCNEFKYSIADPCKPDTDIPEGFEKFEIGANTWAVFKCIGAMPNAIQELWAKIFSEWLPNAEYEMLSDYDIELYTKGNPRGNDYVSEIWIPVKKNK